MRGRSRGGLAEKGQLPICDFSARDQKPLRRQHCTAGMAQSWYPCLEQTLPKCFVRILKKVRARCTYSPKVRLFTGSMATSSFNMRTDGDIIAVCSATWIIWVTDCSVCTEARCEAVVKTLVLGRVEPGDSSTRCEKLQPTRNRSLS